MSVTLKKSTPVLVVDRIEPALEFWKKLGVEKVVDVPEGDHMGFAILAGQGIEVMYQTSDSVNADLVASSATRAAFKQAPQQGYLFIEVASIEAVGKALADEKLILPLRKTNYGATELGYLDRAGNVIVLAEMAG
ncbi:MAG: hypothetical protein U0229_02420 [Anaeromyxobacter sp.]